MHDGVIPGAFAANVLSRVPNAESKNKDMRSENKRKAPSRRNPRTSFGDWLRYRARAEEEETYLDDEELDNEDLDDKDLEDLDDEEGYEDDCGCDAQEDELPDDGEDDPEEFGDYEEEKELDFDEEDDERAPFPLPDLDGRDVEEESPIPKGRFSDFYRMNSGEEEEEAPGAGEGPGGFEPGQAAASTGTIGGMGSDVPKIERARILMRQLVNKPGITREEIIQQFIDRLPTTESTATSYYEDIAREMGLSGDDEDINKNLGGDEAGEEEPVDELPGDTTQELSQEEIDAQDPDAQGITRTVANSHLVYKRQMEDGKFEELWIYNIGDKMEDSLSIRREILSGTDIPRGHTRSEDGQQSYTLHTMGNAQLLHITGLAN